MITNCWFELSDFFFKFHLNQWPRNGPMTSSILLCESRGHPISNHSTVSLLVAWPHSHSKLRYAYSRRSHHSYISESPCDNWSHCMGVSVYPIITLIYCQKVGVSCKMIVKRQRCRNRRWYVMCLLLRQFACFITTLWNKCLMNTFIDF